MNQYSDQALIEIFHLIFLKGLEKKIDKSLYALKGGCNLRFYLKSIRYSEDIDIDISTVAVSTLQKNVNKLLESNSLIQILSGKGIEIVHISSPKQSTTTQRWKVGIKSSISQRTISTKIEFSRRKIDLGSVFEPIDRDIIQLYKLQPILCNHYTESTALLQKIHALANRTLTQARDIFDINHLIQESSEIKASNLEQKDITAAIENAMSVDFSDFKGQVVAYLISEYQNFYDSKDEWNKIQTNIIHFLEKISLESKI